MTRRPAYDKHPFVRAEAAGPDDIRQGWDAIARHLLVPTDPRPRHPVVVVEAYPGVDCGEIAAALRAVALGLTVIDPARAMKDVGTLDAMLARFLTDDRVFGFMAPFLMAEFFVPQALADLRQAAEAAAERGPVAVVGTGAALVIEGDTLVLADMPRWELQLRLRAGLPNWTAANPGEDFLRKYKRGFFIEWRTADRHKRALFDRVDYFLDTTRRNEPKLVAGPAMRAALAGVVRAPFRVVPFFDPGVWGGQWMRERFDLPPEAPNYAWGFDCVPEENSLLIDFAGVRVEVPSINVVLRHPQLLLGERVHARFGAEFPIRFDFLDTVQGGNLSLQVHPTTDYIRQTFGMAYTQDESYYMLDAEPGASVYLGLRDGVPADAFFEAIEIAQAGGPALEVERFVNRLPARKHDHFSIPAGTVHCAGAGTVVLEISATPYIFTFKLWDWGRVGLDGRPRPVHVAHGRQVLDGARDMSWVRDTTLNLTTPIAEGDGWREESTGLHELEFIETRRHWFEQPVLHDTAGSVHVINLVEGERATIESPIGAFEPFAIGYAESVIVPAAVGPYRIVPSEPGRQHATMRASVRL